MSRRLTAIAVAAGSVAATLVMRRRHARLRSHVDLYFEDGSTSPLAEGAPAAADVFAAARELLAAR